MSNILNKEERNKLLLDKCKEIILILKDYYPPNCCIIIKDDNISFYDCINVINYNHTIINGKDIIELK